MKTYDEVVEKLAYEMFHNYMGGALIPHVEGVTISAFILDVPVDKLFDSIDVKFNELMAEQAN